MNKRLFSLCLVLATATLTLPVVAAAQLTAENYTINATLTEPLSCGSSYICHLPAMDGSGVTGLLEVGGYFTQFDFKGYNGGYTNFADALYAVNGQYSVSTAVDTTSAFPNAKVVSVSFTGADLYRYKALVQATYFAHPTTTLGVCHGARGSTYSCLVTAWYVTGGTITVIPQ